MFDMAEMIRIHVVSVKLGQYDGAPPSEHILGL